MGRPTIKEAEERIRERAKRQSEGVGKKEAEAFVDEQIDSRRCVLEDIRACEETFRELKQKGEECICSAVECVYMTRPRDRIGRGEISGRVVKFAMANYYSERQVYRFLERACQTFAEKRGLRIDELEEL
jgi:hypothetical protein